MSHYTMFRLTDEGNAQRLVAMYGPSLRYCKAWRDWIYWDGARWKRNDNGRPVRMAIDTVQTIYGEAAHVSDEDTRKRIARWALTSESWPRIQNLLTLAQSALPILPAELDRNAVLFNCPNGTLELAGDEPGFHAHRREELLSKVAGAAYDPAATCPTWTTFLERIFADDQALISFVQRAAGYSLTGSVQERCLFILYGLGLNGKTTFLRALSEVWGDYAAAVRPEVFMERKDENTFELASLPGIRFAAATEGESKHRLAEGLVKRSTGGDGIRAARKYQDDFEFLPQFKLWFATNHKPAVRGQDPAIWDRIQLLPFTVRIPAAEVDRELPAKLQQEASGIFNLALEGWRQWRRLGLKSVPAVQTATESYREQMDVLGPFLEDRCTRTEEAKLTSQALYQAYKNWCYTQDQKPETPKWLGQRLEEQGFTAVRIGQKRIRGWQGLELLPVWVAGDHHSSSERSSPEDANVDA